MKRIPLVVDKRLDNDKVNRRDLTIEEVIQFAQEDWDPDDPGFGKSIILPDGREMPNPVPFAPPVGFVEQPTLMQQMQRMLRQHLQSQSEDEATETVEDWNDYPEDEDVPYLSEYELMLMEELPTAPPEAAPPGEAAPPAETQEAPPPAEPPKS